MTTTMTTNFAFPLQRKVKSKLPALPYPKFGARP